MQPGRKHIWAGFTLALMTLLVVGGLLVASIRRQSVAGALAAHTQQVLRQAELLVQRLSDSENARRGYVLSGQERYLAHFQTAVGRAEQAFAALRTLTEHLAAQRGTCERLAPMIEERLDVLGRSVEARRTQGLDLAAQLTFMEQGQEVMEGIRRLIGGMIAENELLLAQREQAANEHLRGTLALAAFGSLAGLGIFVWTFLLLRKADARRQGLEDELQTANAALETRIEERTAQLRQAEQTLRRNEEWLRLTIDSALDAVITIDQIGTVTAWNRQAEVIFGWTAGEAIGRSLQDLIIPERHHEAHARGMEHYLATGEHKVLNRRVELTATRRGGEEFPVELAITPLPLPTGHRFSAFLRDITDRRQAAEMVARAQVELESQVVRRTAELTEANRELEAFSYSVSHDLRAPLRNISGFVDLLRRDLEAGLTDAQRRRFQVVADSVSLMDQLINGLLELSRTSRVEMRFVPVDMGALVQQTIDELPEPAAARVHWRVEPLPVVQGDPVLLRQVWTNLLANAVKYSRQRERPEIAVGAAGQDGVIEFHVRDNGAGFDMAYAGKLFGVFQRLHRANEFEGTGIGLANVQRIVSRHGGTVRAEARVDAGATFYFTLPAATGQAPA